MWKGFPSRNGGKGKVKDTRPAGGKNLHRNSEGFTPQKLNHFGSRNGGSRKSYEPTTKRLTRRLAEHFKLQALSRFGSRNGGRRKVIATRRILEGGVLYTSKAKLLWEPQRQKQTRTTTFDLSDEKFKPGSDWTVSPLKQHFANDKNLIHVKLSKKKL